jgi:subfamily B ATP-binding cassette protein MsbA
MAVSTIALLFSVGLGLILPLVIRNLVDLILVDNDLPQLNRLAIGLFIVFILQAIASFVHRLSLAYVGENAVADIRVQVYSHLQALSLRFFGDYADWCRHLAVLVRLAADHDHPIGHTIHHPDYGLVGA